LHTAKDVQLQSLSVPKCTDKSAEWIQKRHRRLQLGDKKLWQQGVGRSFTAQTPVVHLRFSAAIQP